MKKFDKRMLLINTSKILPLNSDNSRFDKSLSNGLIFRISTPNSEGFLLIDFIILMKNKPHVKV